MRRRFEKLSLPKMIIVSTILFLFIVVVIDFLIAISKFSLDDVLSNMLTLKYALRKLVVAVIYGLIIGFIYYRKQKKASKS